MTSDEAKKRVCRNVPLFPVQGVGGAMMVSPNCVAEGCAIWVASEPDGGHCGLIAAPAEPALIKVRQ